MSVDSNADSACKSCFRFGICCVKIDSPFCFCESCVLMIGVEFGLLRYRPITVRFGVVVVDVDVCVCKYFLCSAFRNWIISVFQRVRYLCLYGV